MLRKFRSIIALALALVLTLSVVGCGTPSDTETDPPKTDATTEAPTEEATTEAPTEEQVINLNGRTITFVTWGNTLNITAEPTDVTSQTYYARMKEMEEKYNCVFEVKKIGAGEILSSFQAGEMGDAPLGDVVLMRLQWARTAYNEGLLLDLSQVFDPSLDQFTSAAIDALMQNDGSFYSIAFYQENPVENLLYFNKDHFEAQGIDVDALYQEVLNGTWTMDKLFEVVEKATVVNNGVVEVYGGTTTNPGDAFGHYLIPYGADFMLQHDDGTYSSGMKLSQMDNALDNIIKMYATGNFRWQGQVEGDNWETSIKNFYAGTQAMHCGELLNLKTFTETATFEVGVLPMPKGSASNTDYPYGSCTLNVAVMPASLEKDMEVAQAIADMTTYIYSPVGESTEKTLEEKYSVYCSDEESVQILLDAATSKNYKQYNYITTGLQSQFNEIFVANMKKAFRGEIYSSLSGDFSAECLLHICNEDLIEL